MKFEEFSAIESLIDLAIEEDLLNGDPSSEISIMSDIPVSYQLLLKENAVLAGIDVAKYIFTKIDSDIKFTSLVNDGKSNEGLIAKLVGNPKSVLRAERTALNFLQRMSGVATSTASYVDLVSDFDIDLVDTRKTIPGWRILDKYSVRVGGGVNHRLNLGDLIMLKDNHIAGNNILDLVNKSKSQFPGLKIEVEVETHEQMEKVLETEADIIMLDNWGHDEVIKAVKKIRNSNKNIIIEISGGIDHSNIRDYALAMPDRISIGAITHSVKAIDISMKAY
jgi:nicotinate-nucleotide pyrophosphorylase (carboxylating)